MRTYSEERPSPVTVSAGIREWYLTVNIDITEIEHGFDFISKSVTLDHEPTKADITEAVIGAINESTDEAILTGYEWNGKKVWLSSENQFNFKAAYDLAVQTSGQSLPVKFKLGEDAEGRPVYHTFDDMAEFSDFYFNAIYYINECLKEGWRRKDEAVQWAEPLNQEV